MNEWTLFAVNTNERHAPQEEGGGVQEACGEESFCDSPRLDMHRCASVCLSVYVHLSLCVRVLCVCLCMLPVCQCVCAACVRLFVAAPL